jgi:hypothetical protein
MEAEASAIDLTTPLDGDRFRLLLDSLPDEVIGQSERWTAWFLGQEKGQTVYIATRDFTLAETLANCHCYREGDRVTLARDRAIELGLLAGEYPTLDQEKRPRKEVRNSAKLVKVNGIAGSS